MTLLVHCDSSSPLVDVVKYKVSYQLTTLSAHLYK